MKLKIRYLNGNRLYYAFLAGGNAVIHDQAYLDKINVFPVPDGDTGTNLASTFRAIAEGAEPRRSIKDTLRSIANAALYGAQGNSGLILAQFLHGMSKEIGHDWMITTKAFGESVKRAVQHAYKAILHPVEGTMITVIREWAEAVYQKRLHTSDFEELFSETLEVAHQSLQDTPRKLAVLARAGVVDAGAKGFVDFLEGILHFIKNGKILRVQKTELEWTPEEIKTPSQEKSLHNRYCSEALLVGRDLNADAIRGIVQRYGGLPGPVAVLVWLIFAAGTGVYVAVFAWGFTRVRAVAGARVGAAHRKRSGRQVLHLKLRRPAATPANGG